MEELEFIKISVGSPFPLYKESTKNLKGKDGAFFEADGNGQGYLFCIYFSNMNDREIETIRAKNVTVRVYENDGMVVPLLRFGSSKMIFEMVFDPTLYVDERAFQFTESNNIITIFGIDSVTNVVKVIRSSNLPLKMIQFCKECWARAVLDLQFSQKFKTWYQNLQLIPLETLWQRGIDVGRLGESYDLQDIKARYQSD